MLVKSCPQRRPAANINETNAAAPFRRAFYAVSGGQERPTRFYRLAAKLTSRAAPTDTALRLFQSRPCYPPPISSAQAERRRYGFGTASMLFRQRPRAPPAAARTRQHKQADKRRRAISLRLPYRFGGGQGYIPTPRRRSSSVKSRTGIDLPILHGNAAVPKAAVRPSPADPAERRHKKRPDKHRCPTLHWISVARPALTAPRRRRRPSPAFGKRQSQSRQTPQLGRFPFYRQKPRAERAAS